MVECDRSERPHADQRPLIESEPERGSGSLAVGRRFTTRCRATIGWPTFTPGKLDQNAMLDSGPRSGVTQPGHSRGNFGPLQLPPNVDTFLRRPILISDRCGRDWWSPNGGSHPNLNGHRRLRRSPKPTEGCLAKLPGQTEGLVKANRRMATFSRRFRRPPSVTPGDRTWTGGRYR
jgi:hypothetical protein